jgi:hypothetical protein
MASAESRRILRGMSTERNEAARFFSHFAVLLNGGVTVVEAFDLFAGETASPAVGDALRDIAKALKTGGTITDGMAKHAAIFPPVTVALMRAGEHSGLLDATAERAAIELVRPAEKRTHEIEVGLALRCLASTMTAGVPSEEAIPLLAGLAEGKAAADAIASAISRNKEEAPLEEAIAPLLEGMPEFVGEMLAEAAAADAEGGTAERVTPLLDAIASGLEGGWLTRDRAARPLAQELRTIFHLIARFIGMGIPLNDAFPMIGGAVGRDDVKTALAAIHTALGNREYMADGMAKHPAVFSATAIALIRNAEEDGRSLPKVADALADGVERGLFVPVTK